MRSRCRCPPREPHDRAWWVAFAASLPRDQGDAVRVFIAEHFGEAEVVLTVAPGTPCQLCGCPALNNRLCDRDGCANNKVKVTHGQTRH